MTVQEAINAIRPEGISMEGKAMRIAEFFEGLVVAEEALEKQIAVDKVIERLEEQAEECKKYWYEFDDEDAFGGMNAYMNSIAIIKEEMG